MSPTLKKDTLAFLVNDQLSEAIDLLQAELTEYPRDLRRVANLQKRLREMEGRVEQGTLAKEEVKRLRERIGGGLRDIVLNLAKEPPNPAPETKPAESSTFVFKAREKEVKEEPVAAPNLGFFGDVVYKGSPSKKEASLTLHKSYGASFHTAVQAIRNCGMEMQSGDREGGRIHATATGNTMARFGEDIHLWISPVDRGTTKLHVIVDSANPETVFDLGRNKQKLEALLHQIRVS